MKKLICFTMCLIMIFSIFTFVNVSADEAFEYERNFPCRKTYDVFRFLEEGYNSKLSDSPAFLSIGTDHSLTVKLDKNNTYCRLFFNIEGENYLRLSEWIQDRKTYNATNIEFELTPHGNWKYKYCDYEVKVGFTNNSDFGPWNSIWYNFDSSGNTIFDNGCIVGDFDRYPTATTNYFVVEISLVEDSIKNDVLIPEDFYFTPLNVDYYLDCCDYEYYNINTTHPNCEYNQIIERKRCKVCGYDEGDNTTIGIYYKAVDEAVPATCTEDGLTQGTHCALCKETLVPQKVVKATGHSYTSKVTKESTYFASGEKTYTCNNCDKVINKPIPIKKLKKPVISKVLKGKNQATVKFKKVTGATGYEINVRKNGKWVKYTTKKLKYTLKKLTKGKSYKVKVRAFVKSGKQIKYSKFSKTKTAKCK